MNRYTQNELNWLKENYSKLGSKECAQILNRTLSSVRQTANKLGCYVPLELRNKLHSTTLINNFIPPILPEKFVTVNCKEVSYILGMLWADGWIVYKNSYSTDIKLVSEDFADIENVFFSIGNWKKYIRKSCGNRKETTHLRLSSKKLVDHLMALDYHEKNKSAKNVLDTIPENLKCYWWRGFFDGDGYINPSHPYRLSFAGPYEQDWSFLPPKYSFIINTKKGKHSYSKAFLCRKSEIIEFGNFLWGAYNTDGIGLKRKYEKFLKLIA